MYRVLVLRSGFDAKGTTRHGNLVQHVSFADFGKELTAYCKTYSA